MATTPPLSVALLALLCGAAWGLGAWADAPDAAPGAGEAVALGPTAQTWRLRGWQASEQRFTLDGRSDLLLQVAPDDDAPGLRLAVTAARLEALAGLTNPLSDEALLESYVKRLLFKVGAQPQRVIPWDCAMRGGASGAAPPTDPRAFGLQGDLGFVTETSGWWRACMVWDRPQGALLIALAWQEGPDQAPNHPAALLNTVLLNTRFNP
jgi:hypothetical protein